MKKLTVIFVSAAVLCGLAACTPKVDANRFRIEGDIQGLSDGDSVVAIPVEYSGFDAESIAAAAVSDGHFVLEGETPEPRLLVVKVKGCYGYTPVMVEPGQECSISGTAQKNSNNNGGEYFSFRTDVSGSPLTDEYKARFSKRDTLDAEYEAMNRKYAALQERESELYESGDKEALAALRQTPEAQQYNKESSDFLHHADSVLDGVMLDGKDDFWGPIMVYALTAYISPDMKDIYEQFSDAAKNTLCGQALEAELYPAGRIGSLTKDFTVKDSQGNDVSLSGICGKNKLVLLDFWASWCNPCRKEIPNVKAIYNKHHENGFEVVSISIDESEEAWLKAVEQEQLVWPNFRNRDVADLYKVSSVPTMYLIDGSMHVVGLDLRGQELAEKVDELMGK